MVFFQGFPTLNWMKWYPGTLIERNQRPAVQTFPYKSDIRGFNTRFSLYDLECKERQGVDLTKDEEQFLCYVRSLDNQPEA